MKNSHRHFSKACDRAAAVKLVIFGDIKTKKLTRRIVYRSTTFLVVVQSVEREVKMVAYEIFSIHLRVLW